MRLYLAIIILSAAMLAGCSSDNGTDSGPPPPTIVSTVPADGAVNVDINTPITATFSKAMNPATISSVTFYMDKGVTGAVTYSNQVARLWPDLPLDYGETYTATVSRDAADETGLQMLTDRSWTFTTTYGVIMPLAVGNRWIFEVKNYDANGDPIDTTYDTTIITSTIAIGSETWYIDNDGQYYLNKSLGLYLQDMSGQDFLFLKYPATVGEVYSGNPDISEIIEVKALSDLVASTAGLFYCYRYESTSLSDNTWLVQYLYAPNKGPVLIRIYDRVSGKLTSTRLLVNYSLL